MNLDLPSDSSERRMYMLFLPREHAYLGGKVRDAIASIVDDEACTCIHDCAFVFTSKSRPNESGSQLGSKTTGWQRAITRYYF